MRRSSEQRALAVVSASRGRRSGASAPLLALRPRRIALALALAATVAAVSAGTATSGSAPSLLVYSGQHPGTIDALAQAFQQATGIHVEVRTSLDATLATQIVVEGSHSPADVFLAENSPALEDLQQRHLLAPVAASTLARVPKRDSSAQGDWVGIAAHASCSSTTPTTCSPRSCRRRSWGLPILSGRASLRSRRARPTSSRSSSPSRPSTARQRHSRGSRRSARTRSATSYSNNTAIVSQVNAGQAELAVIDPVLLVRAARRVRRRVPCTRPCSSSPPAIRATSSTSRAPAILKSSSHQAEAQSFSPSWSAGRGRTRLARNKTYEYPARRRGCGRSRPLPRGASSGRTRSRRPQLGNGQLAVTLMQQTGLL